MTQQANDPIRIPTVQEVLDEIISWFREVHLRKLSPDLPLSSYKWLKLEDVLELVDTLRHQFSFKYPDRDVNVSLLHGMTATEIAVFVLPLIRQARVADPRACDPGAHKPVSPTNRRPWQQQALKEERCVHCGRRIKRMRSGWYLVNKEPEFYIPPPAVTPRLEPLPLESQLMSSYQRSEPTERNWSLIFAFVLFLIVAAFMVFVVRD